MQLTFDDALRPDPRRTAACFIAAAPAKFRSDFPAWLDKNWAVWLAFSREADRIYARGRTHYSARTILEWLRHQSALAEVDSEWKLNNNIAPDLARLWLCHHPERAGFFEVRHSDESMVRAA